MNFFVVCAMLFSASNEMPLVNAASPKMQTTFSSDRLLVARGAHAEGRRQGRAGVARAVAIVLAFGAQRKTVQAVRRADGVETCLCGRSTILWT